MNKALSLLLTILFCRAWLAKGQVSSVVGIMWPTDDTGAFQLWSAPDSPTEARIQVSWSPAGRKCVIATLCVKHVASDTDIWCIKEGDDFDYEGYSAPQTSSEHQYTIPASAFCGRSISDYEVSLELYDPQSGLWVTDRDGDIVYSRADIDPSIWSECQPVSNISAPIELSHTTGSATGPRGYIHGPSFSLVGGSSVQGPPQWITYTEFLLYPVNAQNERLYWRQAENYWNSTINATHANFTFGWYPMTQEVEVYSIEIWFDGDVEKSSDNELIWRHAPCEDVGDCPAVRSWEPMLSLPASLFCGRPLAHYRAQIRLRPVNATDTGERYDESSLWDGSIGGSFDDFFGPVYRFTPAAFEECSAAPASRPYECILNTGIPIRSAVRNFNHEAIQGLFGPVISGTFTSELWGVKGTFSRQCGCGRLVVSPERRISVDISFCRSFSSDCLTVLLEVSTQ